MLLFSALAQKTNELFLPEEDHWTYDLKENAQIQADAIKAGECWPAEQDPEGHWGMVVNGFQLSIRSQTNVFMADGPIHIAVTLRNITAEAAPIFDLYEGHESSFYFEDEAGHAKYNFPPGSARGMKEISAKHQIKYKYDFSQIKPGTYKIRAEQIVFKRVPRPNVIFMAGTNVTHIASGVLEIKVLPAKENEP